jgi:mannosylglucosylglycerate synthase
MPPTRKPRVAILHYAAPPTIGGVEQTVGMHARLLADHGYTVKVIAGRGEPFDARVPMQIMPTLDSRHPRITLVGQQLAQGIVPDEFNSLEDEIQRALDDALTDVDCCIVHNALTLHKNLALTAALREVARTASVRLIGWCHDFAFGDPVYMGELHDGSPWDLLREKWDGVKYVVVSAARQRELAALFGIPESEIVVVPPGLDAAEFLGVSQTTAQWMNELNLLEAAPLLLLPARVTRRKNIELAIEITAALRARGSNLKLIVMGPLGPHNPANADYLEELRELRRARGVENAVIFLQERGAVDDATRRDLYLLADALLFPSEREGFGIPILEAGLVRLPIFCADIPPFRESALEYARYFGLDESPAEIAARIDNALSADPRYQMKQRVVREYDWERIFTAKIEPLIRETRF